MKHNSLKMYVFAFLVLVVHTTSNSVGTHLEVIDDNEFINLCQSEKYVVALFSRNNCKECDSIENELLNIREDLVDDLGAWVVKVQNSNLVQTYSPSKEPALVFIRHGISLLYSDQVNDELILHTFRENREPGVKELDDSNFESLTQAATGATTGDWLVFFYSKDCVTAHRLTARWEAVAAALKTRMNVARVNRDEGGAATARRFKVYNCPSFILFRFGKMYRYDLPSLDVPNFVHFATEGFKKLARAENVPVPKSPFDDLTQMIADYMAENPWVMGVFGLTIMLGILIGKWCSSSKISPTKPAKKKPSAKENKDTDDTSSKKAK